MSADATRKSTFFAIAAWAGLVFGVAEGAVLCLTRQFPVVLASYKTSPHVLWIAPLLDVVLFLLVAAVSLPVLRIFRARATPLIAVYIFGFLGWFAVISAPRIIHPASAAALAAGLAALFGRIPQGSADRRAMRLRRSVVLIPVAVAALAVGTGMVLRAREWWTFRHVPAVSNGSVNVLMIVLDTVRRDHFWWAGDSSYTPQIDRFALRGVRYEDAWSVTSWSLPSQVSMLTGTYPHEHRADWPGLRLDANTPTLAGFLAGRGYVTAAFSGNAAWITPEYLGRGFHHFEVYRLEDHFRRTSYGRVLSRLSEFVGLHYAGRGKHAPAAEGAQALDPGRRQIGARAEPAAAERQRGGAAGRVCTCHRAALPRVPGGDRRRGGRAGVQGAGPTPEPMRFTEMVATPAFSITL